MFVKLVFIAEVDRAASYSLRVVKQWTKTPYGAIGLAVEKYPWENKWRQDFKAADVTEGT
jgi:hypothetical protein